MSAQQSSTRPCPYCHEEIRLDALRCPHCKGAGVKQALARKGPKARTTVQKTGTQNGEISAALPRCPPVMLDNSPDGGGLGVWVLVDSDETTCTYEYAGGIA
jgi:glutaredoxin